MFDMDSSGTLSPNEIREAMTALGYDIKHSYLSHILHEMESKKIQQLTFEDFISFQSKKQTKKDSRSTAKKAFSFFDYDGTGQISLDNL